MTPEKKRQFSFYADDDVAEILDAVSPGVKGRIINQYIRDGFKHGASSVASGLVWGSPPEQTSVAQHLLAMAYAEPTAAAPAPPKLPLHEWITEMIEVASLQAPSQRMRELERQGFEIFSASPFTPTGRSPVLVIVARRLQELTLEEMINQ